MEFGSLSLSLICSLGSNEILSLKIPGDLYRIFLMLFYRINWILRAHNGGWDKKPSSSWLHQKEAPAAACCFSLVDNEQFREEADRFLSFLRSKFHVSISIRTLNLDHNADMFSTFPRSDVIK